MHVRQENRDDEEGPPSIASTVAEPAGQEWQYGWDAVSLRAWRCKAGAAEKDWSLVVIPTVGPLAAPLAHFEDSVWKVSDVNNRELKKLLKDFRAAAGSLASASGAAAPAASAPGASPPPSGGPQEPPAQLPQAPPQGPQARSKRRRACS